MCMDRGLEKGHSRTMLLLQYTKAVMVRAAEGSVTLTDRLSILLVPVSALIIWADGISKPSAFLDILWRSIAIAVSAVVLLRLLASAYLIWRDDVREKHRLQTRLDEELWRLDRAEREAASQYTVNLRLDLSKALGEALASSEFCSIRELDEEEKVKYILQYMEAFARSRRIINELSYDVPLRVTSYNLTKLLASLMEEVLNGRDPGAYPEKIQSLKKLTFRLLHKREPSEAAEMVTMFQAQMIAGDLDEEGREEGTTPEARGAGGELRGLANDIRRILGDPELVHLLRLQLEEAGPRGFAALAERPDDGTTPRVQEALENLKRRNAAASGL